MADHGRTKNRKDRIMDAALRIFAEKSFQEATIAEISKEAGVSEATVYEYFGTKEDLLFAIPEKITNDTFEESQAVLPYIKDVEGRMRAILLSYIQLYQNNPHYSALVLLQLMSNKRFRQTAAHEAIRRSAHNLLDCIREGIANGTFRSDADAYLIRSMLMGAIEHLFIHWHMQGKPKRDKTIMDMLDPFLEIVFNGIRAKKEQQGLTIHLNLQDTRALGEILQNGSMLKSPAQDVKPAPNMKQKNKQKTY
ncbi:MAG TPA: TetR/AcrR family transcriptional regulator [Smithellaceae bacterium]|nr:TetR/AcrR family transcriptional regulator [Smithellaceae bacterium]HPE07774.1 TetR/AcrR family transcriptional regulator [Smithellaceae bacterium]HRY38555.1 TetR/AcrR family transcriptional regulator [Smithellaceae bacterium]